MEEFLLTQNSAKLELGGEFLLPAPSPFVAMISVGGQYRQFQCIDRVTKKVKEGFEAALEVSLEGGLGAGYTLKRQGRKAPPGLSSAGRRAYRRQSAEPLPWYKQWSGISGAAGGQFDSGADGNCYCPDSKKALVLSIFAQGRGTAVAVGGSLKGSIEWDFATPFKWENFDSKIESTLGFRVGVEASLTIGGNGKGTWIGYFEDYVH